MIGASIQRSGRWAWRLFALAALLSVGISLWDYAGRWYTPRLELRNFIMLGLFWGAGRCVALVAALAPAAGGAVCFRWSVGLAGGARAHPGAHHHAHRHPGGRPAGAPGGDRRHPLGPVSAGPPVAAAG